MMKPSQINMLGVNIDAVDVVSALELVSGFLKSAKFHHIVTVNPEFLVEASSNSKFREVINNSDLKLPDGFGLLIASKFTGKPLKSRVTGVDFVYQLSRYSAKNKYRIFLLGGKKGIAKRASHKLKEMYPDLKLYFSEGSADIKNENNEGNSRILEDINNSMAEILLVAYGSPWQDLWISDNARYLEYVKVAVGVGGSFDFISGERKRAPVIFRKIGLEWLFRLIIEPKRIKRIFRAVIVFPSMVLLRRAKDLAKRRVLS